MSGSQLLPWISTVLLTLHQLMRKKYKPPPLQRNYISIHLKLIAQPLYVFFFIWFISSLCFGLGKHYGMFCGSLSPPCSMGHQRCPWNWSSLHGKEASAVNRNFITELYTYDFYGDFYLLGLFTSHSSSQPSSVVHHQPRGEVYWVVVNTTSVLMSRSFLLLVLHQRLRLHQSRRGPPGAMGLPSISPHTVFLLLFTGFLPQSPWCLFFYSFLHHPLPKVSLTFLPLVPTQPLKCLLKRAGTSMGRAMVTDVKCSFLLSGCSEWLWKA